MTTAADLLTRTDRFGDASELGPAIAAVLGKKPVSVTIERTHFPDSKPVQHVLRAKFADGSSEMVFAECCPVDAKIHADRVRASLTKRRNGQKAGFDSSAVVVAGTAGLVLRRPGLDERLPGLRLLHDRVFACRAVETILGHDFGPLVTELVAHRLGKRAVLRIRGAKLDLFVRLRTIKSGDGDARFNRHRALWHSLSGQTDLRIPEPLGVLPEIGASFFDVLPGEPPCFEGSDTGVVARAIAALQALDPAGLPAHSGADEARILFQWLGRCQDLRPELARRITPGLTHLMAKLEQAANPPRPCHRDLHEKQILVSKGVAGFLDFDTLCLSDPALDVGNLLAHLFLAGQDEAQLRAEFDTSGISLWRGAALYRLAMIYAFTMTAQADLDRLIEEADANAGN